MEHIKPEHQEFYENNPQAHAVLEAFRAIRQQRGSKLQFWDVIDLTVEDARLAEATDASRDQALDDYQALALEAQRQTALEEVNHRRIDDAQPQTISLDRLDEFDDVEEYMRFIDSTEETIVPVTFVGQAEQLTDPASRAEFFKHAGATALVETLFTDVTGDVHQRVELYNLGEN